MGDSVGKLKTTSSELVSRAPTNEKKCSVCAQVEEGRIAKETAIWDGSGSLEAVPDDIRLQLEANGMLGKPKETETFDLAPAIAFIKQNGTLGQNDNGRLTLTVAGTHGGLMHQGEIKNGGEILLESVTGMVIRAACSLQYGGAVAKSIKQFVERTHGETVGQPNFEIVRVTHRPSISRSKAELQTFSHRARGSIRTGFGTCSWASRRRKKTDPARPGSSSAGVGAAGKHGVLCQHCAVLTECAGQAHLQCDLRLQRLRLHESQALRRHGRHPADEEQARV